MASQESAQDIAQSLLRPSISQIALDKFRASPFFSGIDGRGSSIVILDTGIDLNHPFFGADKDKNGISDRIVFSYDFSGNNDPDASDTSGHGSNVSSIAAGIAPGVNIIHLKVFKDKTPFEEGGADPRDIDEALKWVINNARRYNIVSVNMSVEDGLAYTRAIPDSFSGKQLASLASQGIAVITAAGNAFYELNSKLGVTAYSADPNTISVGAVWNDDYGYSSWPNGTRKFPIDRTTGRDRIVSFSQRHPTLLDIFAPGAIVEGADTKGGTNQESGTSQAAPHITGLVALAQQLAVRELGRLLKVEEFRTLLKVTGDIIKDGDDEDDNVVNTGLNFRRVNAFGMGEAILTRKLGRFPTTRNDNIKGRQTNDYIAGFDGNDLLKGEDGQDILQGGFGSDSLFGGTGSDYLNGGRGNDWLSGDGRTDFLTGGGGRDRFVIRQRDGIDVVTDFGGVGRGSSVSAATLAETDTLKFEGSGFTASQLLLTQVGNHTLVSFEGVSDTGVWLKNVRLETL
ncbi:MAG TPA: S8 family serine peptidase, partial [Crinalium sp.]